MLPKSGFSDRLGGLWPLVPGSVYAKKKKKNCNVTNDLIPHSLSVGNLGYTEFPKRKEKKRTEIIVKRCTFRVRSSDGQVEYMYIARFTVPASY